MIFQDRLDAGRQLATHLLPYSRRSDVLVLALPRGGVPVGYEVARALGAPFDVFMVRKLGVPRRKELAMGAIASGGIRVLNEDILHHLQIPPAVIERVTTQELRELKRRERVYRDARPAPNVAGKTVILVDDGLATGSSMRAAATALRQQAPVKLVVAVPIAALETCDELRSEVDEVICANTPEPFYAVSLWYDDFSPTTDEEVRSLLNGGWGNETPGGA